LGGAAATTGTLAAGQTQVGAAGKRLRVGLIGCGVRGGRHAEVITELHNAGEGVDLVGVCDAYQPHLERFAAKYSAKQYKRSQDMVNDPNIDAISIATPDRVHVYNALEAVRAGKDIYCEKPVTHWQQFDKLKELVKEVRARKAIVQVGAQPTSDPVWVNATEMIKQGAIGKPIHAQTGYFRKGDWGEAGMKIDDPHAKPGPDLDWEAFQADAPKRPFTVSRFFQWRLYMDYCGGPSTDLYPHALTRVIKAMGVGFPEQVVAVGGRYFYENGRDVPDTFDMLIKYPEGPTIAVLGTICNDTGVDTVIRGTEATFTLPRLGGLLFDTQPGNKKPRHAEISHDRFETEHFRNFFQCVRSRQKPVADMELGYVTQVALIMSMRAFVEGKTAYFDAATEQIRMS
jgi:predicted dehydrogenase